MFLLVFEISEEVFKKIKSIFLPSKKSRQYPQPT